MNNWLAENTHLESTDFKLVPLKDSHEQQLLDAASDGQLWNLWFTSVPGPESIKQYISDAVAAREQQAALPFVVMEKTTGRVVGSTRFCNVDAKNRRVEIGYTWYARRYQKTACNTQCKYLLLSHAFEYISCIAVEFRTHWHNVASRKAIESLGAKQDGVLRNHQAGKDGIYRDTVVFSIINHEWPVVKKSLEYKLTATS